jgi:tRNA-modifying protein YgfZ
MTTGSMIARLERRAAVRVAGPDWRAFLQGLLTQDVEGLRPGEMRFGALLTPQGRLLFDLFVDCDGEDGARLDVAAARRDELVQRLNLYRLRAKVEVAADPAPVFAAWKGRPEGEGWRPDPRLAELGFRRIGEIAQASDQASDADEDAYDAWRLGLGVPDAAQDCKPDAAYPIEADFDLLNGVDFKKGCFVGQEVVQRMERRSTARTRVVPVTFDGAAPSIGTDVTAGEKSLGTIGSSVDGRGLALLRLDRAEDALAAGQPLMAGGVTLHLVKPDWVQFPFPGESKPDEGKRA